MNKLVIPVMLSSIIFVAGIFAFMPVEKASTVHTTIQGTQINNVANQVATVCSANLNTDTLVATATGGDFIVMYQITTLTEAASPTISDATNTLVLDLTVDTTATGMLAYPAGTVVTISDPNADNPADGCATVIAESGATPSVT